MLILEKSVCHGHATDRTHVVLIEEQSLKNRDSEKVTMKAGSGFRRSARRTLSDDQSHARPMEHGTV